MQADQFKERTDRFCHAAEFQVSTFGMYVPQA
jgi:hypothetical protein